MGKVVKKLDTLTWFLLVTLMSALSLYAPKPVILRLLRASQRNDLSG
jgi:hypothetical protein